MSNEPLPQSEIILYKTEDGRMRIQCRFEDETVWLSQALIAELFQVTVPTVNEHLKGIFDEGELAAGATIRKFRIVRLEGSRQVARQIEHYNLDAILAVGFRVRSHRGTQFRQWATARLSEYLVKGFTMDDERLKNPPGKGQKDYFDELLATCKSHFHVPFTHLTHNLTYSLLIAWLISPISRLHPDCLHRWKPWPRCGSGFSERRSS